MNANVTEAQILAMSKAEFDVLPSGVIRLDAVGTILYYNAAQAGLSRREAPAVGLNFFTDVAPCTAVHEFQGRFLDFVATPGSRIAPFAFVFKFAWGDEPVTIMMVRRETAGDGVYLVVNFRSQAD